MNKQNKNDNAANRKSYVGLVYNIGEKDQKNKILDSLPKEWSELHKKGYIHIHDLDAYGLTYNCLTFDIVKAFPYKRFSGQSQVRTIISTFDFLKELFAKMGNEQSGGMSLANFDNDITEILETLGVKKEGNEEVIKASIHDLVLWCNDTHTRMGQTSYYVSLNIGLANSEFARFLAYTLINEFENAGSLIYKPNIIFKVHKGISRDKNDANYDLLMKALECTSKKMIPTYLLCDCEMDRKYDPKILSIMGCRTRVVDDLYGVTGAVGRSNIDNISINLPRLALEAKKENPGASSEECFKLVKKKWTHVASLTKDILIDRYEKTCSQDKQLFPTNLQYKLWCEDMNKQDLKDVFKHGTLSIGFIGLSEMIEVITGKKYWLNDDAYKMALNFVSFMRDFIDKTKVDTKLNFSLLATSGELISGRFEEIDRQLFKSPIMKKGFYTNSFHVEVDSGIPGYKKLQIEGPFHKFANGGCISYIEIKEAPLGNAEGLRELIEIAIEAGVHYCGFNFPKDVCEKCGCEGTFDICPECGSKEITRIRRVSGYLEVQDFFTKGKKNESKTRKEN